MTAATRKKWFTPALVIGIVALVFLAELLLGPDRDEVVQRLEQRYDVGNVEWERNARFQPERLVLDGRDVSEECAVQGEWASLDDLRIECDTDVGIDQLAD